MMKAWLTGILALGAMTANAATVTGPAPYYAYVAVKNRVDCSTAADPTQCQDAMIGIKDPVKKATVFDFLSSNPFALRLSPDGTRLVVGLSSNDGQNRVLFEVFDDTANNVTYTSYRVVQNGLTCHNTRQFVVADVDGKATAIVPCQEGFTFYPVDAYDALGARNKRVSLTLGTTPFYYNLALEKSADGQWLFGVGNIDNKLGVSAVRLDDLVAGKLDSLTSVDLGARIFDSAMDSAVLAVHKTPPDDFSSNPNEYDILVASNRSKDETIKGGVYVVRQRPGSSLDGSKPQLKDVSVVYENTNVPLNVVDPRGFAISPQGFAVHLIDYGREQEVDNKGKTVNATINGKLISFSVTATGAGAVTQRKLAEGIPGYADVDRFGKKIAAVHPVSIGFSPSGDRLYVYESQWAHPEPSLGGAYLRYYVVNTVTNALNEPSLHFYIDGNNAFASGILIGPECADCLPAIVESVDKKKKQHSSASDGIDLLILGILMWVVVRRKRRVLQ